MRPRRHISLRVKSLREAHDAFMRAPATGGYGNNEGVVLAVMGNESVFDCPTFDSVRLKYDKPDACTFEKAFRACWGGSRDWHDFDLATLQEAHEEFYHLQLPEYVQALFDKEDITEEYARMEAA